MTTHRDFDRIARAWLDLMPSEAPDRAIDAVLQAVEQTDQVRRPVVVLPWRSPMNRFTLIAATALLVTALAGGLWVMTSGRDGPALPSPTPTVVPASPSPTTREAVVAPPQTLWGDWLADVPPIPEIAMPAGMIQLSVDWERGNQVWLQTTPDYRQLLSSAPLSAAPGELRIRSNGSNVQCARDSEGRYGWSRSADGLFLTLTLIEDACPIRATVFGRTWVRSLGAVNDGGRGVNYGVEPKVLVTLPTDPGQRWAMSGGESAPELKIFGESQPFRAFVVVRNPGGFGAPCDTADPQKQDIARTTDAFVAYVEGLPGATVTTAATSIDGRDGVRLDVSIDPGLQCRADGMQAFHPQNLADEVAWPFAPGEAESLYILQMDADTTFLLWYQGTADEEQAVLDSIRFIDALPTP